MPIGKPSAAQVLVQNLADVVQKGQKNVMDIGVDLFGQIGPANQMIALIQKITREADFAALSVGPRAEQLLALLRKQAPLVGNGQNCSKSER